MPNCEICDQELVEGDFEEKIGICVNCIMIESRDYSSKSLIIIFIFFLGGLTFIVTFLQIILNVAFLFVNFEQYYYFLIPPLIVCVVSGSVVIYISFFLKFN
jgi:hypothetical protein